MSETVIRSRVDSNLKTEAQALLERLGLTMSEAIRLFLHQVVIEKGLPFQVKLNTQQALEHDRWFREQVTAALSEADNPKTTLVPQATVRDRWTAKRQQLAGKTANEV